MASYIVLARKWRPCQFSDIVGQSFVARTLMNAIRSQRVHQAYLLTGSRGIGKTTIARIFAKAIRCENLITTNTEVRSCDQCSSCQEIGASTSVDVIEIDGASNNGVDAIREIRENAKYLPSSGKRKIYIIDEVHMLTTAAFNALLKTLEEPPPHVIFVFATTEPHKIPATILSRCQRFDLKRVSSAQILSRLIEVAKGEGVEAEEAALALIARAAEGGMRDALSLLDQAIAYSAGKITTTEVREFIGLIEGQTLLEILQGVFERNPKKSLELINRAYQDGHDLKILVRGLIRILYETLLVKAGASLASGESELSLEEQAEIQKLSELRSIEEMELIFQALHFSLDQLARSPQPKVYLDILMMKCALADALVTIDGSASPTSPAVATPTVSQAPVASPMQSLMQSMAASPKVQAPPQPVAPTAIPRPQVATPIPQGPKTWEGFTHYVRSSRPLLASILEHASRSDYIEGAMTVAFKPENSYFRDQLQAKTYKDQLLLMAKDYYGQTVRIQIVLEEALGTPAESVAEKRAREMRQKEESARAAVQNHPIIREAQSLFASEVGPIEVRNPKPESTSKMEMRNPTGVYH